MRMSVITTSIGRVFAAGFERGEPVSRFGHDLVRQRVGDIRQQVAQSRPRRRLVVDNEDAQGLHAASCLRRGSSTVTM